MLVVAPGSPGGSRACMCHTVQADVGPGFFTNSAAAEIHQVSVSMRNNEHEKRLLLFVLFLFYNKISLTV